jgi:hypothetical protein
MPFTLSHPAAVIPFFRRVKHPLFVVALVIGSVSPDIGYYTHAFVFATYAHSVLGSVVFCMPTGLLLIVVLLLVRRPLLFLIPDSPRRALSSLLNIPFPRSVSFITQICFWIWLGAFTHILWDSFTHKTGWFVTTVPGMNATVGTSSFPVYYLLQQASTVFGGAIVLFFCIRWILSYRTTTSDRSGDMRRYAFWTGLIATSLFLAIPAASIFASHFDGFLAIRVFLFRTAVFAGGIFSVLTFASILIVRLLPAYRKTEQDAAANP